jgi:hypothetical protein
MSQLTTFGLLRAALYYPALVAMIFSPLWMLSFVARAPRSPGFVLRRLKLSSWVAFAANASVYLYGSRTLSEFMAFHWPVPWSYPLNRAGFEWIMRAEALGILALQAALIALVWAAGRRPNPAP